MWKILTIEYWNGMQHPEAWAALVGGGLMALCTLLSVAVAAWLTYKFSLKNNRRAHDAAIKADRLRREIDALEKMWGLLACMSMSESGLAIFRWREDKEKRKAYFFHHGRLCHFVLFDISEVFYRHCGGLYMPVFLRDLFFEYKSQLMGLYIRYEKKRNLDNDSWIEIKNKHLIKRLQAIYNDLNNGLRDELDHRYNALLLGEKHKFQKLSRR